MSQKVYEINGNDSSTLQEFAADFTKKLNLEINWQGNLDAFNDILRGGLGTPEEGFILVWRNSDLSRKRLGYSETIKWLNERIEDAHPSNKKHFEKRLEQATQNKGETIFDLVVNIITQEEHSDIILRLK